MANLLVICDRERSYALHLMEYFYQSGEMPCEIRVCTDPERIRETGKPEETVLLVAAETSLRDVRESAEYKAVLILSDSADGPAPAAQLQEGWFRIDKYCAVPTILEAARRMFLEGGPAMPGRLRTVQPLRVLGVYSPAEGCFRSSLALTAGRLLASGALGRPYRTVYLNLDPVSGLEGRIGRRFRGSLSDLLYYNACAPEKTAARLQLLKEAVGGLDVLPPMRSWLDLRDVKEEDWLALVDTIGKETEYEILILDLTEHADGFLALLLRCGEILMPMREDGVSEARLGQLREALQEQEAGDVWGRIRRVDWPREILAELAEQTVPGGETDREEGGAEAWIRAYLRREILRAGEEKNCGRR